MEQVSFDEFFSLMDISGVIIIEDTMEYDLSRTAIMYDYLLMADEDRSRLLSDNISEELKEKLVSIYREFSKAKEIFNWEDVPKRDIEFYIEKRGLCALCEQINRVKYDEIEANCVQFQRYGLGVKSDEIPGYKGVLEGVKRNKNTLPIRIYMDFSATELKCIEEDIQVFAKENYFFLCVIDNYMKGEARGKEIIKSLQKNKLAKKHGICIALSSQQKNISVKTKEMYVGFVNKSVENIDNEIKKHLIMSQYNIMLRLLKEKRLHTLEKSFTYASNNMEVAVFLAAMAKEEGITNHEILNQWIDLREKYYTYQTGKEEIKRTILLSSLFEKLDKDEVTENVETSDIVEFQRFEQYDYDINVFMSPPMTGDIFCIKGKYYLLLGQECDLSIRNGHRKNPIAEMVPISIVKNKDMGNFKEDYNYEKVLLGKFKTVDGQSCNIAIDCTKRDIIDNEILDLCTFNEQGESQFFINGEMDAKIKFLLPTQWQQYYNSLKERFNNLVNKHKLIEENKEILGFSMREMVGDMGSSHNDRLVSIIDFDICNNMIKYDVKRVCRIRNHMLLINKLYLEYRGRQAFNTINMDVGRTAQYTFEMENTGDKIEGKNAIIILTTSRNENSKIKRRVWLINKQDLLEFIEHMDAKQYIKYKEALEKFDDKILLENSTGWLCDNMVKYTKQEKENELLLKIKLL